MIAHCEIDPADATAMAYACSAATAPPSGAKVRRTVTTYCEQADVTAGTCPLIGLVASVDGPRLTSDPGMGGLGDITTYTYYQTDHPTCASGGACPHRHGDLWKITSAQGYVTEYVTYDKNGRAMRIKDANGTITDFTYHPRGWLINRIVRAKADGTPLPIADAALHLDYDGVGNVTKVVQPDNSYLAYTYDDAHRLIKITDNLDNTIDYCPGGVGSADCLDAAGNRLVKQIKDPNDTIKRTVRRQYDQLNRLQKVLNAASQPTFDATDGYDANGNLTASTDGLGVATEQTYDPLNRLIETLQDAGGTDPATADTQTTYAYDARDNLRQVTDPDGLATVYDYDGLNNLTGLHSPDTGDTTYTYDLAGNRTSQTDNRGVTSTYTYDALNRLTGIAYPTASLDVTYAYDQSNTVTGCTGSFPLGRLSRMTDASGTITYCYDRRGNATRKVQITNGVTLITQSTYTLADRLATFTYPSGAIIAYTRDALGRITAVSWKASVLTPPVTIVGSATYAPFGPLTGLIFGNGRTQTRSYDQDYVIDSIAGTPAGALTLDYGLDVMGDVTSASDTLSPSAPDRVYAYDPLYRLTTTKTGGIQPDPLEQYTYGPTGDRLSASLDGDAAEIYTYTTGTHRLASIDATARNYDANGNTLTGTALGSTLGYDDRNRLVSATRTGTQANYRFNGRGERVEKTVYTGIGGIGSQRTTRYAYDEGGRLLGDYGPTGTAETEYVYLDAIPIAVVKNGAPYYIETDHLGTPRQVIDPARNVAVWTWDLLGSTFGTNASDEDPDGDSTAFEMNLRFSGQYFDAETGLSYNYFRDYEPGTGRYVESDPIGLVGGITTYTYVGSSPIQLTDAKGLDYGSAFWNAWNHYCDGTGTDWTIPFNMINWGDAVALAKRNIRRMASSRGCVPGVAQINENIEAHAVGAYSAVIGRHTLKSSGTLTTHCDCSWRYSGSLSSALGYDPYDFNPSNRGWWGEFKARIGRTRCQGKPFKILLPGSISITLSGFNAGRKPGACCGRP